MGVGGSGAGAADAPTLSGPPDMSGAVASRATGRPPQTPVLILSSLVLALRVVSRLGR